MKNLDTKSLILITQKGLHYLQRYASFLFIIGVLLIYTFLVLRINALANVSPTDEAIAEKANTVKRLKLDQTSIDKIEQLEDQNVGVQSIFDKARTNPFQD